jgi:hypothetical protein
LEITLKISTNKKLVTIIYLLSLGLYSQYSPDSKFYREDQFFIGSTYFIQTEKIDEFKQNGFSGNFQVGFVRDLPLNKNSTKALGIGFGYERNYFTSNIQPVEQNDRIDYRIIVSRFLESKNKITFSSISLPIEYRWRKSSIDKYKFWRIYSGFKIKKNFSLKSNPSYGSDTVIKDFNDWTSSIYINAGYNTWNISLEYDLNPIIEDKKTTNGDNLNISFFRLGLIFYFL